MIISIVEIRFKYKTKHLQIFSVSAFCKKKIEWSHVFKKMYEFSSVSIFIYHSVFRLRFTIYIIYIYI